MTLSIKMTKYNDSIKSRIFELVNEGKTESDVCLLLDVSRMTLNRWKKRDDTLNRGINYFRHSYLQSTIEKALLAKAMGLTVSEVTEETIEMRKRKNGDEYPVKVKKVKRQLPPDMKALDRYIKKYLPELDIIETSQITIKIDNVESMSFRELLEYEGSHNAIDKESAVDAVSHIVNEEDASGGEHTVGGLDSLE